MEEIGITERTDLSDALKRAVRAGDVGLLTTLLQEGAPVNARDKIMRTVLHYACEYDVNTQRVIGVLLRFGAEVDALDCCKESPLHVACWALNQSAVDTLLRHGVDTSLVNGTGRTPLHNIANSAKPNNNKKYLVDALLAKDKAEGSEVKSSQHLADHSEGDKVVYMVNQQDTRGNTALHLASERDNKEVVCSLLHVGVKVGVKNNNGMTALHMAAISNTRDVVDVLVDKGEDVNVQDLNGDTPLHIASGNDNKEVVRLLLRMSAKVGVKNKWGMTALHMATSACAEEVVYLLVDYGEYVSAKNFDGNTPLHFCSRKLSKNFASSKRIFNFLIVNGAKVDDQNMRLKTPYEEVISSSSDVKLEVMKDIETLFITQVTRLKTLGLQNEFDINWRLGPDFYDDVRTQCCKELEDMKSTTVVNDVSLYQVLSHINKPFLLSAKDLRHIDEFLIRFSVHSRFEFYYNLLKTTFQRAKLLTLTVQSFYAGWKKQMVKKLPCEMAEHILTFLSNEDLRSLYKSE